MKGDKIMAKLPNFRTLEEEAEFWEAHSLTEYLDELEDADFQVEGDTYLTMRVTSDTISTLRNAARKREVSLQGLLRGWIESVNAEGARSTLKEDRAEHGGRPMMHGGV